MKIENFLSAHHLVLFCFVIKFQDLGSYLSITIKAEKIFFVHHLASNRYWRGIFIADIMCLLSEPGGQKYNICHNITFHHNISFIPFVDITWDLMKQIRNQ